MLRRLLYPKTAAPDYEGLPPCVDSPIHRHVLEDPVLHDTVLWVTCSNSQDLATSKNLIGNKVPVSCMRYQKTGLHAGRLLVNHGSLSLLQRDAIWPLVK